MKYNQVRDEFRKTVKELKNKGATEAQIWKWCREVFLCREKQ